MSNACSRRMLVVGLAACAASTLSVYELRAQQPMHDHTRQGDATKMKASRALCYFSSLKGMNVNDASGSKVTDIKDVVFDRNSGDIMGYVVDADEDRLLSPHDIRAMLKDDGTVTLTSNLSAEAIETRQQFEAGAFDESNPTSHREWWDRYEVDATKWSDYGDATDMDNHDNTNRDTNFLGIGDKSRLVPLSVANITRDGKIYLDASQSMLTNSPVAPRSFKDLNNAWNLDEIFNQRPIAYR